MEAFTKLGLNDSLVKAVTELGFTEPTPVQEKTIPVILNSEDDLIALAQTGTGKTAGFGLPIIQKIKTGDYSVHSLILAPTRELCIQITRDLEVYAKYSKNVKITAVYGGSNIVSQIKDIKKGVHIIVGTPGRTLDLVKRKVLKLNTLKWLVLDEADEMLNMGFKEELDAILAGTPEEKQTLLFSATMPRDVRRIANRYMHEPEEITVGKKNAGADNVSHCYYVVRASDKYLVLKRLADMNPNIYGIVFCRTRAKTKETADKLMSDGYNADALHGDLSQAQRDYVMTRFRNRNLQLLVATDVAARGLDVQDLTHIINFELPDDPEIYIHRSGRTGRAGKSGLSISIAHTRERRKVADLERITGKKFKFNKVPGGQEICEKRLFNLIDKIENIEIEESQIEKYLPLIFDKLKHFDHDDLIKRFVSVEFNRFLDYYKDAADLNIDENEPRSQSRSNRNRKRGSSEFARFFISIGKKEDLTSAAMIGLINDNMKNRNIKVGRIDILKSFSFFEIEKEYESKVIQSFKGAKYKGVKLVVELSKPEKKETYFNKQKNKRSNKRRKRF